MLQTDQQFHSLNSQSGRVEMNQDGSPYIYFGPEAPAGKQNNWLPANDGEFSLQARFYWPGENALDPLYAPSPLKKR